MMILTEYPRKRTDNNDAKEKEDEDVKSRRGLR
jgi:hypothetical protein